MLHQCFTNASTLEIFKFHWLFMEMFCPEVCLKHRLAPLEPLPRLLNRWLHGRDDPLLIKMMDLLTSKWLSQHKNRGQKVRTEKSELQSSFFVIFIGSFSSFGSFALFLLFLFLLGRSIAICRALLVEDITVLGCGLWVLRLRSLRGRSLCSLPGKDDIGWRGCLKPRKILGEWDGLWIIRPARKYQKFTTLMIWWIWMGFGMSNHWAIL